jgi:hypothetical protein
MQEYLIAHDHGVPVIFITAFRMSAPAHGAG